MGSSETNQPAAALIRKSPCISAAVLTLSFTLLYAVAASAMLGRLDLQPERIASNFVRGDLPQPTQSLSYLFWGIWERFDTCWYLLIAQDGYARPEAVVFYPFYPLLIKALMLSGVSDLIAAVLAGRIATFFLIWGMLELFRRDFSPDRAFAAVITMLIWPGAFILFGAYPDALVMGLSVWSIEFARRGKWWHAGLLGGFAGLTKALGVLVIVPLWWIGRKTWRLRIGSFALCVSGAIGYFCWLHFTGRLQPGQAYPRFWRTVTAAPYDTLWSSARAVVLDGDILVAMNLLAILVVTHLCFMHRQRIEYKLYSAALLLLFLAKKTDPLLQSSLRYVIAVFPAWAGFAQLPASHFARIAVYAGLFALNLYLLYHFWSWSLVV